MKKYFCEPHAIQDGMMYDDFEPIYKASEVDALLLEKEREIEEMRLRLAGFERSLNPLAQMLPNVSAPIPYHHPPPMQPPYIPNIPPGTIQ